MQSNRLIMPLLVLITLAAYAQVVQCKFVAYDDQLYVTENPHVLNGLTRDGARWALTTGFTGYWHPLTWFSLMTDAQIFHADNPGGFHLTNLLLHIANTLLVFGLLCQLTGSQWRSGITAALFAVHPLRVESVAWVAERKDVLSSCLGLLAIIAYVTYAHRGGWGRYLLSLLLMLLSLMAKPMLLTLPFVFLLLDYWPLQRINSALWRPIPSESTGLVAFAPVRSWRFLLVEKLPFLALSIANCVVVLIVQANQKALAKAHRHHFAAQLINAAISYVRYLGKMVWFENLAVIYPFPDHWPLWQAFGAALLLLTATGAVLYRGRRYPWLPVGWFWFLIMLLPVIGLVQAGDQAMADRYAYLSTLGILIMIVWSLPERLVTNPRAMMALRTSTAVVVAILAAFTWRQVGYWKNSTSLFSHTVKVTNRNARAEIGLADSLGDAGDNQGAITHYLRGLEIEPMDAEGLNNVAVLIAQRGDTADAIKILQQALATDPDYAEAECNLGNQFSNLNKYDLAIPHFQRAIQISPFMFAAYNDLGIALGQTGKSQEAIAAFRQALLMRPNLVDGHYNLAVALKAQGMLEQAVEEFQTAASLSPDSVEIHLAWVDALTRIGQFDKAIAESQICIRLRPDDPQLRQTLNDMIARSHDAPKVH